MGMMFMLYFVGLIVFVSGLAWLATVAGIAQAYVTIGALVLLGIAAIAAAARGLRQRDPA